MRPRAMALKGGKRFDGNRNRYWLMDNLTNSKYALVHDAFYNYYRLGLDQMYDKENDARSSILNAPEPIEFCKYRKPEFDDPAVFLSGKSKRAF